MPQIVEAHIWKSCLFEQLLKPPIQVSPLYKASRISGKDEVVLLPGWASLQPYLILLSAVFFERIEHELRQHDPPFTPLFKVDITPTECENFTAPHPSCHRQGEQRFQAAPLCRLHQRFRLFRGKR